MHPQEHSTIREGLVAGMLGAAIVAVWYLVFDSVAGQPFHTPNALGKVFFRGDLQPGTREIVPGVVAGYTVLHLAVFALAGIGLTLVVHLAVRNLALRMGLWLGLVVMFVFFTGLTYMLSTATGERVPLWSLGGGSLLAVATMGTYLWRRHPQLAAGGDLGDEVKATPHAPGAPRG